MSPLRLISLAYSVGQALGLDATAEVGVRSKWILLPEWANKLDQLLMVCISSGVMLRGATC